MIVDIDKYKINKEFVRQFYLKRNSDEDIRSLISMLACSTMCPCIVIAYWMGEFSNWHPDTIDCIKSLTKFYGYDEILSKPEGAPL